MVNKSKTFGIYRDRLITETVYKMRCLNTLQIELMFFSNLKPMSAKRQCQNSCRRLVEREKLNKIRLIKDECNIYYAKSYDHIEHIVMANWMLLWYKLSNKIIHFEYEKNNFQVVKPDIYAVTYNPWIKENPYDSVCFEMDKTVTNEFDKVLKYNKLYENKVYDEWAIKCAKFPKIIITTTSKNRFNHIKDKIIKQNKYGHRYNVLLLDDLKEECISGYYRQNQINNIIPTYQY